MKSDFSKGISHGIPIALGYFSVSFGFGITAVRSGLSIFQSSMISLTSLTSAGQLAGVDIISAGGTLIEMILVQLTINIRYALMGLSLSQKLDSKFSVPQRLIASYGITDEIFAVCSAQNGFLSPPYMYGIILISAVGWVAGTTAGATAGQLLPVSVSNAMGIMLYGMFTAIIIPPSKKQKSILFVVCFSMTMSIILKYAFANVSSGFAVIICAVTASMAGAYFFPLKDEENQK